MNDYQHAPPPPKRSNTGKIIAIVVSIIAGIIGLIVILGIVAAVALPALMNQRTSAVDEAMKSYVMEVVKNVENEAEQMPAIALDSPIPDVFATEIEKTENIKIDIAGTFENYGVVAYVDDSSYEDGIRGFAYYSTEGGMKEITQSK